MKVKNPCPWCGRKIVKPIIIQVFMKREDGKLILEDEYKYCTKFCGRMALIVWKLVEGARPLTRKEKRELLHENF